MPPLCRAVPRCAALRSAPAGLYSAARPGPAQPGPSPLELEETPQQATWPCCAAIQIPFNPRHHPLPWVRPFCIIFDNSRRAVYGARSSSPQPPAQRDYHHYYFYGYCLSIESPAAGSLSMPGPRRTTAKTDKPLEKGPNLSRQFS